MKRENWFEKHEIIDFLLTVFKIYWSPPQHWFCYICYWPPILEAVVTKSDLISASSGGGGGGGWTTLIAPQIITYLPKKKKKLYHKLKN